MSTTTTGPQDLPPFDVAYAAIHARDRRFDGRFYTAVLSTGIYCRPSCPALTPQPQNVRFVRTSAEAQSLGLRPCLRCFPEALPELPDPAPTASLARQAMARIAAGALDDDGVPALAAALGTSTRTLDRALREHTGASAVAHARAHRARAAFRLLVSTGMPVTDVAFAAGFGSVRAFNETMLKIFGRPPVVLRETARRSPLATAAGTPARLSARLPARGPVDVDGLLGFLGPRTLPGIDRVSEGRYETAVRLGHGVGRLSLGPDGAGGVRLGMVLDDVADLTAAIGAARRLFDLDADSPHIDAALARLPWLRGAVRARPGARIPGEPTLTASLLRAVTTQQVSVASGGAQLRRLVEAVNEGADDGLRPFPTAAQALDRLPAWFRGPAARRAALEAMLGLIAARGEPEDPAGRAALLEQVGALHGIGPWTLSYARMRALGDPDADLSGDGALLTRARGLGLAGGRRDLAQLLEAARPWRSYAALHLWSAPAVPTHHIPTVERSTP